MSHISPDYCFYLTNFSHCQHIPSLIEQGKLTCNSPTQFCNGKTPITLAKDPIDISCTFPNCQLPKGVDDLNTRFSF